MTNSDLSDQQSAARAGPALIVEHLSRRRNKLVANSKARLSSEFRVLYDFEETRDGVERKYFSSCGINPIILTDEKPNDRVSASS